MCLILVNHYALQNIINLNALSRKKNEIVLAMF